jgi:hypothetical protein
MKKKRKKSNNKTKTYLDFKEAHPHSCVLQTP